MIGAMINEIRLTKTSSFGVDSEIINTIYFGGGTPSILTTDEIKKLLDAVRQYFSVAEEAEITLEANPDDITRMKLAEWKSIGINRFSIGVQSFKEEDLLWMNRAHNATQALDCIEMVKEAGFKNFSVDLIYGTPTLNDDDWRKNVQIIIDLDVPHISCYALTVEANTALHKMINLKKSIDVDAEKQASQFLLLIDWLEAAGYEHYEISNFAKPGYRSKHNSSYWQGKGYFGIGPSAHSFFKNKRRWNISNNALYLKSLQKDIIPYEEETLTEVQKINEYIMTSLRTMEGIDLEFIEKNFGDEISRKLKIASKRYLLNNKIENRSDRLILTKEGKLFADGIAADIFLEEKQLML